MNRFVPGQRWLSQTEPELGLGLVIKSEPDKVSIVFPSTETTRVYTIESPPLTRVRFSVGDILKTQDGKSFVVEDLTEKNGLVTYLSKGKKIDESRLSDSLTFSKPMDRLLNGQVDDKGIYNLRHRALYRRFKTYRSPLRGLLGGRFHPSAHQLYVATQATRSMHPRVLLADEAGLGRRVEAGLILQRLQVAGHANRVLLVAPERLLEWTETELTRRFGFSFTRLSEKDLAGSAKPAKKTAAKKAKAGAEAANPFLEKGEWLSCSLESFKSKPSHQAADSEFDVLVVDGVESLEWSETSPSPAYKAVEHAAEAAKSLILISSNGPELDLANHEGAIRLLDSEEFSSLRRYHKHRKDLEPLAAAVIKSATAKDIDRETEATLKPLAAGDPKIKEFIKAWKDDRDHARDQLVEYLLDSQECGRSVFRNTHHSLQSRLTRRTLEWVKLEAKPEARDDLREEFKLLGKEGPATGKTKAHPSAVDAPAALWLADIISPPIQPAPVPAQPKSTEPPPPPPPPPPKALVVCANRGRAMAAAKALAKKVPDKIALITDEERAGLPTDFAAMVVGLEDTCGRGFSGVDFLVLWDTPHTLVEARLGSALLDLSGDPTPVKILLPHVEDTPQELLGRWLADGLLALTQSSSAQDAVVAEHFKTALDIAKRIGVRHNPALEAEMKALAKKTLSACEAAAKKIEKHRDLLLETASCRPSYADQAHHRMTSSDDDASLDIFVNRVLEQCGMVVESKESRQSTVKWNPEATHRLEDVPKDGLTLVFNRKVALANESGQLLTWDHPLVASATERLLATAIGNTAYVVWEDERAQIVLLEGIFLSEPAAAPPTLQAERYMPPTPVRVVVSHELEDLSGIYTTELLNKNVRNGRREWLRNNARPLHSLVPGMLRNLVQRAEVKAQELAAKASHQTEQILNSEISRLHRLPQTARRKAEIARIEMQIVELKKLMTRPHLRLDSLRLVRRGPSGKGI